MTLRYDVVVVGSGFAGSILARILSRRGRKVLLVDAARHPRFAIGESSTPIADFLLRRLGEQYGLSDLISLSSYGDWQTTFPDLACGLKRGFSYFDHRHLAERESEDWIGQHSMIVAASPSDDRSDTHWYRPDVDSFLLRQAESAGVEIREGIRVDGLQVLNETKIRVRLVDADDPNRSVADVVESEIVVDASGSSAVSARLLNQPSLRSNLKTRSVAAFAHFEGVDSFSRLFDSIHRDARGSVPFDSDNAAQHHLIDGGWVWMLRLNNAITSVGVVLSIDDVAHNESDAIDRARELLESRLEPYPLLHRTLRDAPLVAPESGVVSAGRLQRWFDPVPSPNCLMLPSSASTIDPLHSTGIAHALAGVLRVANLVERTSGDWSPDRYRQTVLVETSHLDRLVHTAYRAMRSFPRFHAACMLYFTAAIATEEQLLTGTDPSAMWLADDERFVAMTKKACSILDSDAEDRTAEKAVREMIVPWNTAGLMSRRDYRYAYTATK